MLSIGVVVDNKKPDTIIYHLVVNFNKKYLQAFTVVINA